MRTLLVVAAVLGLLLTACDDLDLGDEGVRGSGNLITESRDVSGFDEIVLLGSGDVMVTVTGSESLTLEAEDNIMPLLTTRVRGSRLELGSDEPFSATRSITYTISAAVLESVTINGSGAIVASGLDVAAFSATINGSGDIVPSGSSQGLDVDINGSGKFSGEALTASVGKVRIAGSGSALVNVSDDLDVGISGSGGVEYLGTPVVATDITGSGNVSQR